jgi:hypothetical protein
MRRAQAGRQHTPKIAFVAGAHDYTASSGKQVNASDIDLNVRALSMGKLHHAMMGAAAAAIGTAAEIPGNLKVGAQTSRKAGEWTAEKVRCAIAHGCSWKAGIEYRATYSELCPAPNSGRSRCQARHCHGCPCPVRAWVRTAQKKFFSFSSNTAPEARK